MGANTEKKKFSRRDFLKIGGLVGIASQGIAISALGYQQGKSFDTYTGWEDYEGGTQFFDRKPFELSIEELYQKYLPKIGQTQRPNPATDMPPARAERIMKAIAAKPDWKPEDGRAALELGPDLDAYYEAYLARGQDRFATDLEVQMVNVPAWVANHEKYDDHFALALAYFGAWEATTGMNTAEGSIPANISEPPEVSDYQYYSHNVTVDLREVNKARAERNTMLKFKSPDHAAKLIKRVAHLYGASVVGITTMNPDFIYSMIRGIPPGPEPAPVPQHWKFAIVLGVPHEWDQLVSNPQYGDSLDAYSRVRYAGWKMADFLKRLGYASRWHCPPLDYDLIATPFAVQAGLGEWSRMACVVCPETGGNVRLAVVTTELEMTIDHPVDFGVTDFCKKCKICAELCPSGAISFNDTPDGMVSRGLQHWDIDNSKCFGFWMESMGPLGCRLCIAACPFSRKNNWVHGIARVADPLDKTGIVNSSLIWLQKALFDAPEAKAYKRPPDGCFASYRPAPDWLNVETWFDVKPPDPHDLCKS